MKLLIRQDCPDFTATALMPDGKTDPDFNLTRHIAGRYGVLFFYPLDFNYVSTVELRALAARLAEFTALNATLVAVSCDSVLAHQVWIALPTEAGGIGAVGFPMVSDLSRTICASFDMLVAGAVPEAATVIVDPDGKVVFQLRHDTAIERSLDRILHALKILGTDDPADTTPAEQLILLERAAPRLTQAGFAIVAQSIDTDLDHPEWAALWQAYPRAADGRPRLSFPFFGNQIEWTAEPGKPTLVFREGLAGHGTGLLLPDGTLMFEFHSDRRVPRDFDEILRIATAVQRHLASGEIVLCTKGETDGDKKERG